MIHRVVVFVITLMIVLGCDTRGDLDEWMERNNFSPMSVEEIIAPSIGPSGCFQGERVYKIHGFRSPHPNEDICTKVESYMRVCCRTGIFFKGCTGEEISRICLDARGSQIGGRTLYE